MQSGSDKHGEARPAVLVVPDEDHQGIVISVVGLSGTGKSTLVKALEHLVNGPTSVVYFGGIVVSEVERQGLDVTEDNEHRVRTALRRKYGMGAMALLSLDSIAEELTRSRTVLVDGMYSSAELQHLREAFREQLTVLAVHSDRSRRIERLKERPERALTVDEMNRRDDREVFDLDKAPPIVLADYHVLNNGSIQDLEDAVSDFLMRMEMSSGKTRAPGNR